MASVDITAIAEQDQGLRVQVAPKAHRGGLVTHVRSLRAPRTSIKDMQARTGVSIAARDDARAFAAQFPTK